MASGLGPSPPPLPHDLQRLYLGPTDETQGNHMAHQLWICLAQLSTICSFWRFCLSCVLEAISWSKRKKLTVPEDRKNKRMPKMGQNCFKK